MKVSWSELSKEEQLHFGDGCSFVPDFCFNMSCRQHDFNYSRGGTLFDKIKADYDMAKHMILHSTKWWHYIIVVIYWLGLTLLPVSYFHFTYGKYKNKEEILK